MPKNFATLSVALMGAAIAVSFVVAVDVAFDWLAVDRCLDEGGAWNSAQQRCDR